MPAAAAVVPASNASAYNGIAPLYDLYWRGVAAKLLPALDRLVLTTLARGSRALDLCCGAGHLAAALTRRGLVVTGVDGSEDMIAIARRNAPRAAFVVADARYFEMAASFDAVISTGDSMNHMLAAEDLRAVFSRVRSALVPGGVFVFDMNMAEAFETQWHKSSTVVGADHLLYVRGRYDRARKLGSTDVTLFNMQGSWSRLDLSMFQRCYTQAEVRKLLLGTGFSGVRAHNAKALGIRGRLAVGRTLFVASKPDVPTVAAAPGSDR